MTYTGWKEIAKRLGVKDIRTARKWVRLYRIPVTKMIRTVCMEEVLYIKWCSENVNILKKNGETIKKWRK